jgi:hypothetical protein
MSQSPVAPFTAEGIRILPFSDVAVFLNRHNSLPLPRTLSNFRGKRNENGKQHSCATFAQIWSSTVH